jgi:hypothetical protein
MLIECPSGSVPQKSHADALEEQRFAKLDKALVAGAVRSP